MPIPRLIYGYLSQSTAAINIAIPWSISNQDGMFKMNYSIEEAVKNDLRVWAKTNWGERPMRFRFGLDARRYLFDPISSKDAILQNAQEQLAKYFSFLLIKKLEVLTSDDSSQIPDNSILLTIEASFKEDQTKSIQISEMVGS